MLPLLQVAGQVADITTDKHRKAFLGAVAIRRDGKIVSSRNGSSLPFCSEKTPSSHAERRLLNKAGYGSTVYVARVRRDGSFGLAKPCDRCMAALRSRGVEVVYWTVSNTHWEGMKP